MKVQDEKRESVRYDHVASVVYAYHNSDKFFDAKMCNFCNGGMCFESAAPIEPGSDVYIMTEDIVADEIDSEIYDGYLAEVRWCRRLSEADPVLFRIGVKYYQTVIEKHSDTGE